MVKSGPDSDLETVIDYRFRHRELLLEALTHSSYARETGRAGRDNELMEFLGDAVLNFVVSVRLADAFPDDEEGRLSRGRARIVGAEHLAEVAARIDLGSYLRLGRGEEKTGGRAKSRLMVNALEALIAAIYRDGGLRAATRFVRRFILPPNLAAADLFSIDYKSALQEHLQAQHLRPATYRVVGESGPEHRKVFTVEAVAGQGAAATGQGINKKSAEQQAARELLERFRQVS